MKRLSERVVGVNRRGLKWSSTIQLRSSASLIVGPTGCRYLKRAETVVGVVAAFSKRAETVVLGIGQRVSGR
jgi:hypothetical protein